MRRGWTLRTLKRHLDALRKGDKRALDTALKAADEKAASHNDLINEMRRKENLYVTKRELYAWLIATTAIIGVVAAVLKLFVK